MRARAGSVIVDGIAVVMIVAVVVVVLLFLWTAVNGGAPDRDAGWPNSVADLEGEWVLDRSSEGAPEDLARRLPQRIRFAKGPEPRTGFVTDGTRWAGFELGGAGILRFGWEADFEPLLPRDLPEVWTMTHRLPAIPEWDHLTFRLGGWSATYEWEGRPSSKP